jgi:hypothetical protein
VQPQADLLHPGGDSGEDVLGLPPRRAMHHRIIRVPLEPHGRELPSHEQVDALHDPART